MNGAAHARAMRTAFHSGHGVVLSDKTIGSPEHRAVRRSRIVLLPHETGARLQRTTHAVPGVRYGRSSQGRGRQRAYRVVTLTVTLLFLAFQSVCGYDEGRGRRGHHVPVGDRRVLP